MCVCVCVMIDDVKQGDLLPTILTKREKALQYWLSDGGSQTFVFFLIE